MSELMKYGDNTIVDIKYSDGSSVYQDVEIRLGAYHVFPFAPVNTLSSGVMIGDVIISGEDKWTDIAGNNLYDLLPQDGGMVDAGVYPILAGVVGTTLANSDVITECDTQVNAFSLVATWGEDKITVIGLGVLSEFTVEGVFVKSTNLSGVGALTQTGADEYLASNGSSGKVINRYDGALNLLETINTTNPVQCAIRSHEGNILYVSGTDLVEIVSGAPVVRLTIGNLSRIIKVKGGYIISAGNPRHAYNVGKDFVIGDVWQYNVALLCTTDEEGTGIRSVPKIVYPAGSVIVTTRRSQESIILDDIPNLTNSPFPYKRVADLTGG